MITTVCIHKSDRLCTRGHAE